MCFSVNSPEGGLRSPSAFTAPSRSERSSGRKSPRESGFTGDKPGFAENEAPLRCQASCVVHCDEPGKDTELEWGGGVARAGGEGPPNASQRPTGPRLGNLGG